MSYLAQRPSASAPSDGSRTITTLDSQPREDDELPSGDEGNVGTLHLRGGPRTRNRHRPSVVWRDDVVDNEGAGRKSSKICCIYHKPKRFDESSSEESSDSDSDSDSSCNHGHSHSHSRRHANNPPRDGSDSQSGQTASTRDGASSTAVHEMEDVEREPNAYERVPGKKQKKGKAPDRTNEASVSLIFVL
ncbi:hypothetical protein PHLGIDRAFT_129619 [Phlebiopsis gigantea 11061_1 CR5-6]|uniref:Type 1 phosphatases regulator n=1 Tax=Phlebiopsis gigantea (strain 11061_1 CR5-6) TaxID=745531 RepID=A0A0C3S6R8_PHLG1|nr:hypothetical protein PHLGIDRAFT_129619 [Phlebiopsis gigantea 11061_1 CR5-6]